jgi:transcriptional regulator with XRE-family HTH domain
MRIGQKIKSLAKEKNVKAIDLAEELGRTKQNIYAIFRGEQKVSTDLLEDISRILGVSPSYFWRENENGFISEGILKAHEDAQKEIVSLRKEIELYEKLIAEKDEKFQLLKKDYECVIKKLNADV